MAYTSFLGNVGSQFDLSDSYDVLPFEPLYESKRNLDQYCISFIREQCENMFFDQDEWPDKIDSAEVLNQIPIPVYQSCLSKDVDRLCLERALHRFALSGSKDSAFDVYLSFCEIFKPFGNKYSNTGVLLEVLAEHEAHASSLMMKHRDHYSHSVYVFMIGIAVFSHNKSLQRAFYKKYCPTLTDDRRKNAEFLRLWGMVSLFHDIGYPLEIAHQQIQAFFQHLHFSSHSLFVSYRSWEHKDDSLKEPEKADDAIPFLSFAPEDIEKLSGYDEKGQQSINYYLAVQLYQRMNKVYCESFGKTEDQVIKDIFDMLQQKTADSPKYMDHAYFSGVILLKTLLTSDCTITAEDMDVITAILLHNSMFRHYFNRCHTPLTIDYGQPLAYLLMLCDELQCWDRTAYGQNSRKEISPWDFDLAFHDDKLRAVYYFDETLYDKALHSNSYLRMIYHQNNGYEFVKNIAGIVDLGGNHTMLRVQPVFVPKKRQTGQLLSETAYMDLYQLAVALNGRYEKQIKVKCDFNGEKNKEISISLSFDNIEALYGKDTPQAGTIAKGLIEKLEEDFENLPLEFKLSNIDQARNFAYHLEQIGCFYTSRNVDYEILTDFSKEEIKKLAYLEHERWMDEKRSMGWRYGNFYLMESSDTEGITPATVDELLKLYRAVSSGQKVRISKNINARALCRHHKDMVPLEYLTDDDILKDTEPLRCLIKLLNIMEGIHIYRR